MVFTSIGAGQLLMFVVGLTGGICSGKSTVGALFECLEIDVFDADVIARQLVATNTPALQQITDHFGEKILKPDHSLNRSKLRDIIFSDPTERKWLENLLHPLIKKELQRATSQSKSTYCIAVIPLLIETGPYPYLDKILVVDIPDKTQIERLMARDNTTAEQAQAMLGAQCTRQQRLAMADDTINNSGDIDDVSEQISKLHQHYLNLAGNE